MDIISYRHKIADPDEIPALRPDRPKTLKIELCENARTAESSAKSHKHKKIKRLTQKIEPQNKSLRNCW